MGIPNSQQSGKGNRSFHLSSNFRVVERFMLFFWDFNHCSTCGIGKRINSFVLGIEQSLSFFHLYLVEECSQFCMPWYWYQHTFVLSLSMFTIEALVFFSFSSWYPMWFETFYFILFIIRMVAFSVYIYIYLLYLLGWKSFFFNDYSYFARPNFGMMCMPASSIVAEVVHFQRVMVSI